MRKLTLIAAAGLLSMPVASEAKTLNELLVEKGVISAEEAASTGSSRVSYKNGTRLEFPEQGFDIKMNLEVKTRYSYLDYDKSGGTNREDASSFNTTLARVTFDGNVLNKQFSYRVQNDFAADSGGNSMRDVWLQWNLDDAAKLRMGQFKVPFGRQELNGDTKIQFIDRTNASDFFTYGRNRGAMFHGGFGDAGMYAAGIFNGVSTGEGINAPGVDNNMMGAAAVSYNFGDFGSREEEGDMRKDGDLAGTIGAAVAFGQGSTSLTSGNTTVADDFDDVRVDVDAGLRVAGFSTQAEFIYANIDYDSLGSDSGEDFYGGYVQAGYMFVPEEMELAARFGMIDPDGGLIDEQYEYAIVYNYFLNGHALKIQTGVAWEVTNYGDDEDITDARYQVQLVGMM